MKEFKGTPWPWSVNYCYNWIESESNNSVVIGGGQGFDDDDAHLIAAAPELLEALQYLTHALAYGSSMDVAKGEEMAEAAIKKALGEQQ